MPIIIGDFGTIPKGLVNGMKDLEVSGNHQDFSIIKIGHDTEKCPGDLRRFAVT